MINLLLSLWFFVGSVVSVAAQHSCYEAVLTITNDSLVVSDEKIYKSDYRVSFGRSDQLTLSTDSTSMTLILFHHLNHNDSHKWLGVVPGQPDQLYYVVDNRRKENSPPVIFIITPTFFNEKSFDEEKGLRGRVICIFAATNP